MNVVTRRELLAASVCGAASLAARPLTGMPHKLGRPVFDEEVAWLAEVQRPPDGLPDDGPQLKSPLKLNRGRLVASPDQWTPQAATLKRWWLDYLRPLPPRKRLPDVRIISTDRVGNVQRQLVRYETEPGQMVDAYLLRPADQQQRRPGVVVFHSTVDHSLRQPAGVQGRPEKAFGLKLAQRGMVALCPRNYLWPTNSKIAAQAEADAFHQRHPQSKGMARMLFDGQVALDLLCAQPDVDSQRLAAVGHSLGAKEVLYLAALDERVKASVSSEGGIGTTFSNWDADWYLGPQIKRAAAEHEHHELLALVAPRAFLLVGGDSADGRQSWPFITSALPVYRLLSRRPRLGLYNHGKGHSVPPEAEKRIYEWLQTYI